MDKHELRDRLDDNLLRVKNLVDIYESKITTTSQGRRPVGSGDVLRAAVVLLHATLEDFVRTISEHYLPTQPADVLDRIPIAGLKTRGRAEKFFLGKLADFRGKTVDEVLAKSVSEFLRQSNYNSREELADAILSAGLDKTPVECLFGQLGEMMTRRHWIVHRADKNPKKGKGQHKAQSIGTHHVRDWLSAVEQFADAIIAQLG